MAYGDGVLVDGVFCWSRREGSYQKSWFSLGALVSRNVLWNEGGAILPSSILIKSPGVSP